ncbi:hypothetical protein LTR17_013048 [Elasticomyces elasticus]|nr:hypothetical protein LTR17_013048 [Elasticomyces elasticus]
MSDYSGRASLSIDSGVRSASTAEDTIMTPEEGSAHVVSPAIADDDLVFQEYLSNEPSSLGRRMIRSHATMTQSSSAKARPIMFHIVPKRGQREIESRRVAQSHLIALEELLDPYRQDLIDLQHVTKSAMPPLRQQPDLLEIITAAAHTAVS